MMLFTGVIYAWSILKAPLGEQFGWNNAELGLNFTITMGFFCMGGILGGVLVKKISPRLTIILSALVVFAGFLISSQLQGSIGLLYISYGGMCGLGIGVVYNVIISCVTSWFPDKRATASGALMMGFGASTLVLGTLMGKLMSAAGWRSSYLILGGAIALVLIAGSFFIKKASPNQLKVDEKKSEAAKDAPQNYTVFEMLKRASFWKFFVFLVLITAIGTGVISFAKDFALFVGASETLAITLVGLLSVCNGLGRILTGLLYDNAGRRKTMMGASIVAIAAAAIMMGAVLLHSVPVAIAGLIVVGISYGSMPTLSSSVTANFYGPKNFPLNFSVTNTMLFPASFSAAIAGGMVNASGSYLGIFVMLLCFAIVAFLINLTIKKA